MNKSVTDSAHSVTGVRALLAELGFDAGQLATQFELVIDRFDQWANPQHAVLACTCCAHVADGAPRRTA